jgi:hypothetical protein
VRILIASGSGRYADPWHPYEETSAALAGLLLLAGHDVAVRDDPDAAMTELDRVDLLVVNAGDPWRDAAVTVPSAASLEGLQSAVERGIGVLALHSAVSSLRDHPLWAELTGAIWVPGVSWHPPFGTMRVQGGALPDGRQQPGFEVEDELYCRLQLIGDRHVVTSHEVDGIVHPTSWVREVGKSRVAVDLLGHDARSYASEEHRSAILRLVDWVTR